MGWSAQTCRGNEIYWFIHLVYYMVESKLVVQTFVFQPTSCKDVLGKILYAFRTFLHTNGSICYFGKKKSRYYHLQRSTMTNDREKGGDIDNILSIVANMTHGTCHQ